MKRTDSGWASAMDDFGHTRSDCDNQDCFGEFFFVFLSMSSLDIV